MRLTQHVGMRPSHEERTSGVAAHLQLERQGAMFDTACVDGWDAGV